jgi:glycosidase
LGEELDGVMNYPFRAAILDFALDKDGLKWKRAVMSVIENYPKCALDCCMTIIGSHDTVRAINALSGAAIPQEKAARLQYRLTKEEYERGKKRLMLVVALQFFLPGVPVIYYGDEAGLQGYEDPINRRPFPWDTIDKELHAHYTRLGAFRKVYREEFLKDTRILAEGAVVTVIRGKVKLTVDAQNLTAEYTVVEK